MKTQDKQEKQKHFRYYRSVYRDGRMKKGLTACKLDDILPPSRRRKLAELKTWGVSHVEVDYRQHGRVTTCVLVGCLEVLRRGVDAGTVAEMRHMDVGTAILKEGDQPNKTIAHALSLSRAIENFIESLQCVLAKESLAVIYEPAEQLVLDLS